MRPRTRRMLAGAGVLGALALVLLLYRGVSSEVDEGTPRVQQTVGFPAATSRINPGAPDLRGGDSALPRIESSAAVLSIGPESVAASLVAVSASGAAIPAARGEVNGTNAVIEPADWPAIGTLVLRESVADVTVSADGWGARQLHVTAEQVRQDASGTLQVTLTPESVKWGQLHTTSGEPVPGEMLRLIFAAGGKDPDETTTDLAGVFPYADSASDLRSVSILGAQWLLPLRRVITQFDSIAVASQDPLQLVASPLPGVRLHMTPNEAARLRSYDVEDIEPGGQHRMLCALAGPNGAYVAMKGDGEHRLRIGAPGWASEWIPVSVSGQAVVPSELEVPLGKREMVRGVAVDSTGKPVLGAWVIIDHWAGGLKAHEWRLQGETYYVDSLVIEPPVHLGVVQTDETGAFCIPFRLGKLVIHHPAFAAVVMEIANSNVGQVLLQEGAVLSGVIHGDPKLLSARRPLSVAVHASGSGAAFGPVPNQRATISEENTFRFTAVRPGVNSVSVLAADDEPLARTTIDVPKSGETSVEIAVASPNIVNLRIRGLENLEEVELRSVADTLKRLTCKLEGEAWSARADWSGVTSVFGQVKGQRAVEIAKIDIAPGKVEYEVNLASCIVKVVAHIGGLSGTYSLIISRVGDSSDKLCTLPIESDIPLEIPNVGSGSYLARIRCDSGEPAPGAVIATRTFDVGADGRTIIEIPIDVATRVLTCTVRTPTGVPLEKFRVEVSAGTQLVARGATDVTGRASIVVPSSSDLHVYGQSELVSGLRTARVGVGEAQAAVDLVAVPTLVKELHITLKDGSPFVGPEAVLEYLDGEGYGFSRAVEVWPDGSTGPIALIAGHWRLRAGDAVAEVIIDVTSNDVVQVQVQ